jgi:hypothetical protein
MPRITVKYWRDIPSMVVVGRGRGAAKASLPERFEQAIDMVAMRIGAKDQDAYIAEWRNADWGEAETGMEVADSPQAVADRVASELDSSLNKAALKALVDNDGRKVDTPEKLRF